MVLRKMLKCGGLLGEVLVVLTHQLGKAVEAGVVMRQAT